MKLSEIKSQPLVEFADQTTEYYKLNNGQTLAVSYRPGLNADPMPGTLNIAQADPRVVPKDNFPQGVKPLASAPESIKQAITDWTKTSGGVAEGTDDIVGFSVDSERAYQAVMDRYGDMIEHHESGIMYAPRKLWGRIQELAYEADGIGAEEDNGYENPEHYGVAEGSYKTYQPKHVAWVVRHGDGKVSEFKPHEDDAANAKYDQVKHNRGASIYAIDQHSQSIPMGSLRALRKKQGVAEGERFPEPLTGYHIVYRKTGNVVHGTPSFETQDAAQKYLMTKMFANHQDFKVAHTAGVKEAKRQPETFGGYDPDDFQEKLQRLKTLAGAGPLKTVYDPKQRVYKNIPTAVQPPRQPKK